MRAEIDGMDVIYRFYECENIYPLECAFVTSNLNPIFTPIVNP